jgi:hypothetical protein
LDSRYLELITVVDAVATSGRVRPALAQHRGHLLGDGGGALAFRVLIEDASATVAALRSRGVPVDDPGTGVVRRRDGSTGSWTFAAGEQSWAWAPFFINDGLPVPRLAYRFRQQGLPAEAWTLARLIVQTAAPAGNAARLARILDRAATPMGAGLVGVP